MRFSDGSFTTDKREVGISGNRSPVNLILQVVISKNELMTTAAEIVNNFIITHLILAINWFQARITRSKTSLH